MQHGAGLVRFGRAGLLQAHGDRYFCCLCFRKVFGNYAYVLERFSMIFAYVLEIICIFAPKLQRLLCTKENL